MPDAERPDRLKPDGGSAQPGPASQRPANDTRDVRGAGQPGPSTGNPLESLLSLQEKVDARAESRVPSDGWAAHEAVLDRLAANVRVAQMHGWTSCAIERVDGATHFTAWGLPPGECERHPIPDWSTDPAAADNHRLSE